jgi:UDP-2-acetamido-3-amino-2,3-dideoxy-glucuronate N-acetyltransferase
MFKGDRPTSCEKNPSSGIHPTACIHCTAIVEEGVSIGAGSSVWDTVHIRKGTVIGDNCIIGEKTYIAYDVKIGNGVKINSFVYICTGVSVEDHVMISAGTVFSNDRLPRAFDTDGYSMKTSDPTGETLETKVCRGATIGAGCTIGPGIVLGEYCMVGMGSVLTRDVAPYQLVYGNPAKPHGYVCVCGEILVKGDHARAQGGILCCARCQRKYEFEAQGIKLT